MSLKRFLKKWLGVDQISREIDSLKTKSREHDQDIIRVMDEQLKLRETYPLVDTIVVPTSDQINQMNEGGPDGRANL